jgi:hypothetical protein
MDAPVSTLRAGTDEVERRACLTLRGELTSYRIIYNALDDAHTWRSRTTERTMGGAVERDRRER